MEDNVRSWETERTNLRRVQEIGCNIALERGVARSPARKRTGGMQDKDSTPASGKKKCRRRTKLKYAILGMDSGAEESPLSPQADTNPPPPSPTDIPTLLTQQHPTGSPVITPQPTQTSQPEESTHLPHHPHQPIYQPFSPSNTQLEL